MNFLPEELLLDDDFRKWVLKPSAKLNQEWTLRLTGASEQQQESVRQARLILLSLPPEETLPDSEVIQLWNDIQYSPKIVTPFAPNRRGTLSG